MDVKELAIVVKNMISSGCRYEEAVKVAPMLSRAAYVKYGGTFPLGLQGLQPGTIAASKQLSLEQGKEEDLPDAGRMFLWARKAPPVPGVSARTVMYRSLFGDGHITDSTSPVYTEAHSYAQMPYMWSKAAALQEKLSALRIVDRRYLGPERDATVHICSVVCDEAKELRQLFYPTGVKDLMNPEIFREFDWGAFAWWLMDDGGRYNETGVDITVGAQDHYTETKARLVASIMTDRLGVRVKVGCSKDSYSFRLSGSRKEWEPLLSPHVHPNIAYKLSMREGECGSIWPPEYLDTWKTKLNTLQHPHLLAKVVQEGLKTEDGRKNVRRSCYSLLRSHGLPYPVPSKEEARARYASLENTSAELSEGKNSKEQRLSAPKTYSSICTPYFPNRYHIGVDKVNTAYYVYCRESLLEQALDAHFQNSDSIGLPSLLRSIHYYRGRLPSMFNPLWAKYLIGKYCPEGGRVLDTCAGWAGRAVGARLAGVSEYVGIEPEQETRDGVRKMMSDLPPSSTTVTVLEGVAEDSPLIRSLGVFDMAITCPPYYNYERYSSSDKQSFVKYGSYSDWVLGFMGPMIHNTGMALQLGSYYVLVVGNVMDKPLVEDALVLAESDVFELEDTVSLVSTGGNEAGYSDKALILRKVRC